MALNEILIVDDEMGIRELLSEILADEGYQIKLAENATQARAQRNQSRPDLVLLDIWMPDTDGITLLKEWASNGQLTMPVVMMSGHGTIETAVEATRIGAFDFLEKPIALQKLLSTVGRALRHGDVKLRPTFAFAGLGKATIVLEVKKRLEQVALSTLPVLLVGQKGSGHEFYARLLHQPNTPWVVPESPQILIETPLDLLQQARDGILFFEELASLSKLEQKGLLFLLSKLDKYNVRLVCATAKGLPALVDAGSFDPALFNILNTLTIALPSLKQHPEDIPELANWMLVEFVENQECPLHHLSTAALNALRNAYWPGNLLQLKTTIKNLALTALNEEISIEDVGRVLSQFGSETSVTETRNLSLDVPLREAREAFEKLYFEHQIEKEMSNMSRVADKAGLERTHLYRKLKQLGIRFPKKGE